MKARSQAKGSQEEDTSRKLGSNTKVSTSSNRPTPFTTKYTASMIGLWGWSQRSLAPAGDCQGCQYLGGRAQGLIWKGSERSLQSERN